MNRFVFVVDPSVCCAENGFEEQEWRQGEESGGC